MCEIPEGIVSCVVGYTESQMRGRPTPLPSSTARATAQREGACVGLPDRKFLALFAAQTRVRTFYLAAPRTTGVYRESY